MTLSLRLFKNKRAPHWKEKKKKKEEERRFGVQKERGSKNEGGGGTEREEGRETVIDGTSRRKKKRKNKRNTDSISWVKRGDYEKENIRHKTFSHLLPLLSLPPLVYSSTSNFFRV